ncbi:MAG: hypothetical protein M0Q51_17010 [Bacteroidales bacterium]|nr:hypothetical protein [Bacteroidales bacterium]
MQIEFLRAFYKDLDKLENKKVAQKLGVIISMVESSDSLDNIPNIKKLKGHPTAYRIRIQNYRVGIFQEGDTVEFARILPRKDIYKYFPK